MRNRVQIGMFLPLLGLTLSGCQKWGEEVMTFVKREGRALSEKHSHATLRSQWSTFHLHTQMELSNRSELLEEKLGRVRAGADALLPSMGKEHSQSAFLDYLMKTGDLAYENESLQGELDSLQGALETWSGVCKSREVFEKTGLKAAGTLGFPELTTPGMNVYFAADFTTAGLCFGSWNPVACGALVITSGITVFSESDRRKQEAIFKEAVAYFQNEQVVQGEELFQLSQKICESSDLLAQSGRVGLQKILINLESIQESQAEYLETLRVGFTRGLQAKRVEEGFAKSPLGAEVRNQLALVRLSEARAEARATQLEISQKLAESLDAAVDQNCFESRSRLEDAEDLLEFQKRSSPGMKKTLSSLSAQIEKTRAQVREQGGCQ